MFISLRDNSCADLFVPAPISCVMHAPKFVRTLNIIFRSGVTERESHSRWNNHTNWWIHYTGKRHEFRMGKNIIGFKSVKVWTRRPSHVHVFKVYPKRKPNVSGVRDARGHAMKCLRLCVWAAPFSWEQARTDVTGTRFETFDSSQYEHHLYSVKVRTQVGCKRVGVWCSKW